MTAALVARLVGFAARRAAAVAIAGALAAFAVGFYAATHLTVDTDIEHMLPSDLAWRRDELALDKEFPQNNNLLVIVIDGETAAEADRAARDLAARLRAEPALFRYVRQPDGGPFFERNGLLFLSVPELQSLSDQLIAAQPLIGSLAQDPSLRGLFDTLALFIQGAGQDQSAMQRLDPSLAAIADAVESAVQGKAQPLNWQRLMTGRESEPRQHRRFVLTVPVLDFDSLEPGARATDEVRRLGGELAIDAPHGLRLRLTGPVALGDEQFATLQEGALRSTVLSIVAVCVILFLALRSVRLVVVILATLTAGLVLTAGFAAAAIGSLNLISVAFGVLFIGLAVDFSIQFSIRYRDQRHRHGALAPALDAAALTIGPSLLLAAGATALGFLSFVPTRYTGIRELGWIAGIGMTIAIALNFLLLPAGLRLARPKGEAEPLGFRRAAPLDRFLLQRRRPVIAAAAVLAAASLALLPLLRFDFDPLNLKNPHSESVATARDLMRDPMTTPYTAEILAPSLADAQRIAERMSQLPEVAQAVTAASFIPEDQDQKLAILGDVALLLGPSLSSGDSAAAPSAAEDLTAIAACRDALKPLAARAGPQGPAARLAAALDQAATRGPAIVPTLQTALLTGLRQQLESLGKLLKASAVTLTDLPPELRDSWISSDGKARIEVFPKGDARDPAVLERFVAAIRTVAPDATGTPVTIQEAGHLISSAFVQAGIVAVIAITVLLALVLRRVREVALVVAPLLLAAAMTMAIMVLTGTPLNYANIIALPLLLGIGVAFDIYFVMNWRAGQDQHLQSSTARAVLFSALTTMSAFGSLALSNDPGTADMGLLLTISLGCTLFCTLFVLPALLGPAPTASSTAAPAQAGPHGSARKAAE